MKALSRDFTTKEKIMLVILCLILLALAYYRFLHVPCNDAIAEAHSQRDMYQTEMVGALAQENQLKQMQKELDSLGELTEASRMESYNNSKAEIDLLNSILQNTYNYNVRFSSVTKSGNQIRRNVSLSFAVPDFASARQILSRLADSEYRCLIGNIQYSTSEVRVSSQEREELARPGRWIDGTYYYSEVRVNATATFYETMYGGTPDAGLPAEK